MSTDLNTLGDRTQCGRCKARNNNGMFTDVHMRSKYAESIIWLCKPCLSDMRKLWNDFLKTG